MGFPSYFENIIEKFADSFFAKKDAQHESDQERTNSFSKEDIERIARSVLVSVFPPKFIEHFDSNNGVTEIYYLEKYSSEHDKTLKLSEDLERMSVKLKTQERRTHRAERKIADLEIQRERLVRTVSDYQTEVANRKRSSKESEGRLVAEIATLKKMISEKDKDCENRIVQERERYHSDYKDWNHATNGTIKMPRKQ